MKNDNLKGLKIFAKIYTITISLFLIGLIIFIYNGIQADHSYKESNLASENSTSNLSTNIVTNSIVKNTTNELSNEVTNVTPTTEIDSSVISTSQPSSTLSTTNSIPVSSNSTNSQPISNGVWVGNTGTKYHFQSCPTLKGKGHQITLEQALSEDREPCKVCH